MLKIEDGLEKAFLFSENEIHAINITTWIGNFDTFTLAETSKNLVGFFVSWELVLITIVILIL